MVAQLAVDITLRCALTSRGEPRTGAAREDGTTCQNARADNAQKYAQLLVGDRCRLVVVALETGGRWSTEALEFVECLARSRAREGCTHTGTICIPRLEEEVVSHVVHLVCASVRHLFDGGAQGVARGGQRRWRDS